MKKLLFLVLLLLPFTMAAQIPAGYYDGTAGKNGAELKTILHNKIKGQTSRTYNQLWTDFRRTDSRPNGTVYCIWTNCNFIFGPESQGGNQQGTGGASTVCQVYNREHVFCASWVAPSRAAEGTPMYTDLFHMYPVDAITNTVRNDNAFGRVTNPTRIFNGLSKVGPNTYPGGYTGTSFEPADEYKGDVARSIFYMVTRYEDKICEWFSTTTSVGGKQTLGGTTFPGLRSWTLELLYEWHLLDPVSAKEIARNDSVFKIQYNRNPFIDHPEFADSIFGYFLKNPESLLYCSDNPGGNGDMPFPEDFEELRAGADAGNYNGYEMQFATGYWYIKGITSMDANDRRNGNRSVRLRGNTTDTLSLQHRVEMNFDKEGGIGTVNFNYGSYSTHSGGRLQLQVSTDEGNTWANYGNVITTPSWAAGGNRFQRASIVVNEMNPARIRILKESQSGSTTVNVDDIDITDCKPELLISIEDLDFGDVAIGRTDYGVIEILGINLVDGISYQLIGENPNVFSITPLLWNPTVGGTLRIGFTPTSQVDYSAEIMFESEDAISEVLPLFGSGSQVFPSIVVRPAAFFNFEEITLGTTSPIQSIEISGIDLIGNINYSFEGVDIIGRDTIILLSENFGTPSGTTSLANFNGWEKGGISGNSVIYSGTTDIRNTSASNGYPGASGGGNVFFAAAGGAEFIISNIKPNDATSFLLSFGLQNIATYLTIFYSIDSTTWTPISYIKTTTGWGLVTTPFSISETTSSLSLKFVGGAVSGGFRIDDIIVRGINELKNTDFLVFEQPWNPAIGGTLHALFSPKKEGEQNAIITVKSTGAADRRITLRAEGITPQDLNELIDALRDTIFIRDETIDELRITNYELQNDISNLYDTIATRDNYIVNLTSNILNLLDTILARDEMIENLLLQILELENHVCPDTLDLFNQVLDLFAVIADLNETISVRDDTIYDLRSMIYDLRNDISNLYDTIATRDDYIVNLKSKIVNLMVDTANLNALIVILDLENEILHDSIKKLLQIIADCNPLGTTEMHGRASLQVYPNPVINELRITNYEYKSGDIVELFDMNGRRVFSKLVNSSDFSIDMTPFQVGTYILRIGNQVARIVKQ